MKNELYELYQQCFPTLKMKKDAFLHKIDYDHSDIIIEAENNHMIGAAVVNLNSILLLCVLPEMRNKGYGKKLLKRAEELIKKHKHKEVILGCGREYLFPGVPHMEIESSVGFFEKYGYEAKFESVDMELNLNEFDITALNLDPIQEDVRFGFVDKERKEELIAAVVSVCEPWVRYYQNGLDSTFVAMHNDKIVGFQLVSWADPVRGINVSDIYGTVGCVGIMESHRGLGIGLHMVAHGMANLKLRGCTRSFIGYTHKENWYAKLGSETVERYWMGRKYI